jgi:branched-chain amino acid transport system ATP-binding protein
MVGQHVRSKTGLFGAVLRPPWTKHEEERIKKRSREILDFFGERLSPVRDQLASDLAYADRRRLEIARAMATEPKLLLLDEPTAGMNPVEKVGLVELIGRLRDELGFTIILIEHDMPVVKGVSDHVVALDYGKVIAEGTYDEVASNQRVIEAYLGKQSSGGAAG